MATVKNSLLARIFGEGRRETRRPRRTFVVEGLEGRAAPSSLLGLSGYPGGGIINGIVTITVTSSGDPGTSTGGTTSTSGGSTSGGPILIATTPTYPGTTSGGTRA